MAVGKGKGAKTLPPEVRACICDSTYQDKRYGKSQRLHNHAPNGKLGKLRCTVCKREN